VVVEEGGGSDRRRGWRQQTAGQGAAMANWSEVGAGAHILY
jgi:hypothetical protein